MEVAEARQTSDRQPVNPITFSVILNRFDRIAREMTLALERSAWTPILALCKDFSCAILDREARLICMLDALPVQSVSLHLCIRDIMNSFSGRVHDGDVFLSNDPYRGNTHIGDLVTAAPVFVCGEPAYWVATRGHQVDTGAYLPASVVPAAENVWQEGITVPPTKFYERGELRQDVLDLFLRNLRYSELVYGDLLAQFGSIWTGRDRLLELVDDYGERELDRYVEAILEYADRRMSEELVAMPDGTYHGEGWIDSDGVDQIDIPIRATVTIQDDRVVVDYRDSGQQGKGGFNGSVATSTAAGMIPFLQYIDPDIPHNDGCTRHIDVLLEPGTICQAEFPASTSTATIVPSDMMMDAVHKAMAEAMPERVAAGSARCSIVPQFAGVDELTGTSWSVMLFNNSGGQGATKDTDGWPIWESTSASGGLKQQSVEEIELLYPLLVEELEIAQDSMGLGASIGGPGTTLAVRPIRGDIDCITFGDNFRNPPHGILGGTPGSGGGNYVEEEAGTRRYFSASGRVTVAMGERFVGVSTGGGGYGDPLRRDIERVRRDVRDGIVSPQAAVEVYGVVVAEGLDPAVDETATRDRRADLSKRATEIVSPRHPNASTWLETHMREDDVFLFNPT